MFVYISSLCWQLHNKFPKMRLMVFGRTRLVAASAHSLKPLKYCFTWFIINNFSFSLHVESTKKNWHELIKSFWPPTKHLLSSALLLRTWRQSRQVFRVVVVPKCVCVCLRQREPVFRLWAAYRFGEGELGGGRFWGLLCLLRKLIWLILHQFNPPV